MNWYNVPYKNYIRSADLLTPELLPMALEAAKMIQDEKVRTDALKALVRAFPKILAQEMPELVDEDKRIFQIVIIRLEQLQKLLWLLLIIPAIPFLPFFYFILLIKPIKVDFLLLQTWFFILPMAMMEMVKFFS